MNIRVSNKVYRSGEGVSAYPSARFSHRCSDVGRVRGKPDSDER